MRRLLTALFSAILFVLGINIGLHWGLTNTPQLDEHRQAVSECDDVYRRIGDGKLMCATIMTTEDEGNTDQWVIHGVQSGYQPATNTVQNTQAADKLMPAARYTYPIQQSMKE